MKKERDLRSELNKRKYHSPNGLYNWIYYVVMSMVSKKYNAEYNIIDDINDCKGPCFLIFNHLSRIDHSYVTHAAYPKKVNMLAGYNEFFRSHLHTVFKMQQILPKKQYTNDVISTKAILSIINQGGCVTFAPEGLASNDGMPKPIVPGTGHLFKKFNVPVYFCELRGQYLQNTKVCLDERYGKTYCTMKLLFSSEDLKTLSVEEIDEKINLAFKHDEYAWQKEKHIKWDTKGRVCYKLNDLCYQCPKCKEKFVMVAGDDYIKCSKCGNGATQDDYYDFHPYEGSIIPETPSRWSDFERMEIIKEIRENKDFSFTEEVKIGRIPNDHLLQNMKTTEIVSEGLLTIDHNGMRFKGNDTHDYDFDLNYKTLYTTITELDSSYFDIYIKGEFTDIIPKRNTSLYITMLIEEMHRLHVNFYKNFPWNDYMYENNENKMKEPTE